MSHFTVLVIGPNSEEQLAPFHEFECTGRDDEFVQNIDITAELRESFQQHTTRRYRDPNGELHDPYEDRFYRDPTPAEAKRVGGGTGYSDGLSYHSKDWTDGQGYRAKVHFVPEGWTDAQIPTSEIQTFAEYCEGDGKDIVEFGDEPDLAKTHKYGYTLVDADGLVLKVVDRTNPNRKWDWYELGGRWTGFFKLKPDAVGEVGRPGLMTPAAREQHADTARIGDIDFEGTMNEAGEEARKRWELVEKVCLGEIPKITTSWETLQSDAKYAQLGWEERRILYWNQHAMKRFDIIKESVRKDPSMSKADQDTVAWADLKDFQGTKEAYIENARNAAITTFAVIKDGKWYERGQMGWWGSVANEQDRATWGAQFRDLIAGLPEDTVVSVYDCHI